MHVWVVCRSRNGGLFFAGKFAGLGSGRKKEKSKVKVVPDMYTKAALVWSVQVPQRFSSSFLVLWFVSHW